MIRKKVLFILAIVTAAAMSVSVTACLASNKATESSETEVQTQSADIKINEEISNDKDGEHAIEVSGNTAGYSNIKVTKTGDSASGDEADFYGDNAAIFATDGATLTLTDIVVDTNGTHANAVFSYGSGTTVNISNSVITTSGNCSGGLMTTGGGTMNATNLDIHTTGNSSAAIRSDRGGGTVTVDGGTYVTDGTGSPAIYSTADITVSNATLKSTASEGVVVEGKNSVTLNNVNLTADHNKNNSDKTNNLNAVMIYQSMSGDASVGLALLYPVFYAEALQVLPLGVVRKHVHQVVVDMVCAEPGQLLAGGLVYGLGGAHHVLRKLCGQVDLIPQAVVLQHLSDQLLAARVEISGIQVVDPELDRLQDLFFGLFVIKAGALLRKTHAAEAQLRYLVSVSVRSVFHDDAS